MDQSETVVGPLRSGVSTVELDGRVCAYSPTTRQVHVLNETASAVLLLADGTRTREALVDELARRYQADPDAVRADVLGALASFDEAGLLEQPGSADAAPGADG